MPSSRPAPRERLELGPRRAGAIPLLMGIVNATPDSFHPESRAAGPREALDLALRLREEGADLIDVGGQSTRPGSAAVPEAEELSRVLPVVEALAKRLDCPISVDTDKAEVARAALSAGASMLNDVTALRGDPGMMKVALQYPSVVLMHMQGTPGTMQTKPHYKDAVAEVTAFLKERKAAFVRAGGAASKVWLDPGIGFGKDLEHNLALIRATGELRSLGPVVLGLSRKSFLGRIISEGKEPIPGPEERLEASLAAACFASALGADMLRVHDVAATRRALTAWRALGGGR